MTLLADTNTTAYLVGWLVGLVIWIGLIVWTVSIARRKGRSPMIWGVLAGVLAFFFSWIALIIVAVLPRKQAVSV